MPRATFMRHARTERNEKRQFSGQADCNTTKEGLELAKQNFNFTEKDFDYYICSPLKRTVQTLNAVIPGKTPIIDKRIIERYLGEWEDMPYDSISKALTQSYVKGYYDPPKSEPYSAVTKRINEFLLDLYKDYKPEDRILIVSHAGVLRQVRDILLPNMDKGQIGNATTMTIDNDVFEKFVNNMEKKKQDKGR